MCRCVGQALKIRCQYDTCVKMEPHTHTLTHIHTYTYTLLGTKPSVINYLGAVVAA